MLIFNNALNAAKGAVWRAGFFIKDKSPELCFIGGTISLVAAGYFLWNGKEKFKAVKEEYDKDVKDLKGDEILVREEFEKPDYLTPKMAKERKRKYTVKAIKAYIKVFFPILIFSVAGIGLMGNAVNILKSRNIAQAAIIAKQNEEIQRLKDATDEEKLEELYPKSPIEGGEDSPLPPYTYLFGENSDNFIKDNPAANRFFVLGAQNYWNDQLEIRTAHGTKPGGVLINEILEYMNIKTGNDKATGTVEGHLMGCTKSKNPKDKAAGYIDFGVFDIKKGIDFGKPFYITINVDATPIYDRMGLPKR